MKDRLFLFLARIIAFITRNWHL